VRRRRDLTAIVVSVVLLLAALNPAARAELSTIRMGVYPGNTFTFGKYVGLSGTNAVDPFGDLALDRMVELANGEPFDVHVYAEWRQGVPADLDAFVARVVARGLSVNMALKYVPPAGRNGDIRGFARWVAGVVAARPTVRVWQITNEANVIGSPDTDGGSKDAIGALIEGVKAAGAVATTSQHVGFNWFYRLDPVSDRRFWSTLKSRGGPGFRAAVDFAGVDIYAGTYIPPLYALDDEAAFRSALEYVRHTLMPLAGLGAQVPIYVQELGYPTLDPVLRTEEHQADALAAYIRASRGLNVGLLCWFQLADATSTLDDGWGLLRADYSRKPAFDVLRDAARTPR
jgi:hypothetical protein